jgi:hypothetical protein
MKLLRFQEHLEFAYDKGIWGEVMSFLIKLNEEEWYHEND